ncbi:MAG: ATP-binding protein [Candidatus Omnitrophota bacterium]|jgi:signal transduction histidine kinase
MITDLNVFSFAGLLLFVVSSCLAFIIFKNSKTNVHRVWGMFNISVAVWAISAFFIGISKTKPEAIFWWRVSHLGITFIPIFLFHVIYLLCNLHNKRFLIFAYFQGVFFVILSLSGTNLFIPDVRFVFSSFYYAVLGVLYHFSFAIWLFLALYSHYKLFFLYRNSQGILKNQVIYLLIGFVCGFSGGATNFLPAYKIDIYPYGNFGICLYCLIATYAILRYRLMDIRIFISRALAFLISYTFLLGVPFFFAYRMYPVLYPIWGKHWWLAPVGLMTFFATLAPLAYDQIRRGVEERFLAEQKRYQKLLLQAASGMAREHNLNRLSKLIVYIVKRIVKIDFAAIFLEDKDHKTYRLKAIRDSGISGYTLDFSYDTEFVKFLKSNKEPCLYEELPSGIQNLLTFPKRVSLVIPSLIEENLLGFIVLGEKNNREPYSEDDINVFKILTNQTAMSIENCLFFDEFKNAQEKIFTAEKLASIGGMADGVAHQIKNRLNHFSIASGELKCEIEDFITKRKPLIEQNPDLAKTFKYAIEIADSLIKNVKMTDGIVRGILTYARVEEKETFFSHFSLREVIEASLELLKIKHELQDFPLTIDLDNCDMVYGVKAQIMESMYNILDNSYEAALDKKHHLSKEEKEKFTPLIKLKLTEESRNYRIEISDNGSGIKDESKQKIFAPFFTTKSSYKSGTGIGMYVVRRIVEENHKGRIWFESAHMQGTKFIIELPKK